jgi:hypothetical protein
VARYITAQGKIADLVEAELLFLQRRIANEMVDQAASLRADLKLLWESDFVETTLRVADPSCPAMSWSEIEPSLVPAVSQDLREANQWHLRRYPRLREAP